MRLKVVQTTMGSSGGCRLRQGFATVYVNRDDGLERRRYTLAHELGHLFLQYGKATEKLDLSTHDEENLCDEFASHLLVNRALLQQELNAVKCFQPQTLMSLAKKFRVNLTPMVIALSDCWNAGWGILILAKVQGHPDRPNEIEFRVKATTATAPWYVPKYATLDKLGLGEAIEALSSDNTDLVEGSGQVSQFSSALWTPDSEEKRSGRAQGTAKWAGRRLGSTAVVVIQPVDVDFRWYRRQETDQ